MFNYLPRSLRNYQSSLVGFKTILDGFLASTPDEPYGSNEMIPMALQNKVKHSNSVRDWVRCHKIVNHDIFENVEDSNVDVDKEEVSANVHFNKGLLILPDDSTTQIILTFTFN